MAICRWAGYPNLFLTFTCNPKWPEIKAMLHLIGQHDDGSRVDIICRVFQIKLAQLMQHIKKDKPFGTVIAFERLPFHLQGQNTIIFEESRQAESVLNKPDIEKTKFTEWFEANKEYPDARDLTYSDFPTWWVWNVKQKKWTRRKKGRAVGRIYFAHPATGEQAAQWASGNELRNLFVTILIHCQVSDSHKLWENNYNILSEDITSMQRKRLHLKDLQLTDKQIEASESKIVLPLATSGIAALLLPNGRAAHSRFHIPLDVTPESTCDIKQGSQLAELLKKTCLIIWDEAPMANKYCLEALDRSLRDILQDRYENSCDRPFGGLTIVCGGDFRQILPVIPKGTRADIVDASLNNSHLWPYFSIYELKENMRLTCGEVMGSEVERIASFDRWLLQIGDGSYYADKTMELIKLPPDISIEPSHNQVE
ncbi:uncharacterized protein [Solanum lycopersicum]|uniref:uncharacterized protein n=1 Tax=Solanum lycopersicum TaxID=4081 RepID=UPI00374A8B66